MPIKKIPSKEVILFRARKIFAQKGFEGSTMRLLAKEVGISPSVLYHYYKDQDEILYEMFKLTTKQLGIARKKLSVTNNLKEKLRQRVEFQLEHTEEVTTILKYYLHYRDNFHKNSSGYVPVSAYKHMLEVVDGQKEAESKAKVMTHAVNGFALEYYPNPPKGKEKQQLVNDITEFLYNGAFAPDVNVSQTKGGELKHI